MMNKLLLLFLLFGISCQNVKEDPWMLDFVKPETNPILQADSTYIFKDPITGESVRWQRADVFNPGAVVKNDSVYLLFRAEDNPDAILGGRTSRIGLAKSGDGIHFDKYPQPVLYPDSSQWMQWDYPGGIEDPRVVELDNGKYLMMHTSWNQDVARLSAAISDDLIHWERHGPVFRTAHNGKFLNIWSKSGSVITALENGRLIAKKIDGKYWMYWGELFVNLAWSVDGVSWTPLLDNDGELLKVMESRPGKYDSHLVEPGPPALWTEEGVILFYNGRNSEGEDTDPSIAKGTYCGGQALFDKNDLSKLISRTEQPFICPDLPHEVTGQYQSGTTFIEGLVYFQGKWFLYYGTADSMVGVAVKERE